MSFKNFDWYASLIAGFFVFFLLILFEVSHYLVSSFGDFNVITSMFWCDSVSFYLSFLSFLLWIALSFFFVRLSKVTVVFVTLSVVFSIMCYSCVNAFFFWVFYEMSILCLLLLLIIESPYSERYVASWYLMGYVVITSLPMLASLFYLSFEFSSFNLYDWRDSGLLNGGFYVGLLVFLSILFITKIPLFPFHVWLPIVHAEASSAVSVCLSGYVMKLGLLGCFRFCSLVLPSCVFSYFYCLFVLFFCIILFFCAIRELDGKRWLALLSLCHIVMPAICLGFGLFDYVEVSFFYCLGHGLSAGVMFILLWVLYEVTGSRNWFLVKSGISNSLFNRICCGACLCTVASLPPTIQFFSEVFIVYISGCYSIVFVIGVMFYLFFGGLVPVFLLGHLLSRHYSVSFGFSSVYGGVGSVSFLVFWSFLMFLLV